MQFFREYFYCFLKNLFILLIFSSGDQAKAKFYEELALDRGDAIHAVLWNEKESMWRDYDSSNHRQRDHFFLSAIAPLFTRCSGRRVNIMSPDFLTKVIASSDVSYPRKVCTQYLSLTQHVWKSDPVQKITITQHAVSWPFVAAVSSPRMTQKLPATKASNGSFRERIVMGLEQH